MIVCHASHPFPQLCHCVPGNATHSRAPDKMPHQGMRGRNAHDRAGNVATRWSRKKDAAVTYFANLRLRPNDLPRQAEHKECPFTGASKVQELDMVDPQRSNNDIGRRSFEHAPRRALREISPAYPWYQQDSGFGIVGFKHKIWVCRSPKNTTKHCDKSWPMPGNNRPLPSSAIRIDKHRHATSYTAMVQNLAEAMLTETRLHGTLLSAHVYDATDKRWSMHRESRSYANETLACVSAWRMRVEHMQPGFWQTRLSVVPGYRPRYCGTNTVCAHDTQCHGNLRRCTHLPWQVEAQRCFSRAASVNTHVSVRPRTTTPIRP